MDKFTPPSKKQGKIKKKQKNQQKRKKKKKGEVGLKHEGGFNGGGFEVQREGGVKHERKRGFGRGWC